MINQNQQPTVSRRSTNSRDGIDIGFDNPPLQLVAYFIGGSNTGMGACHYRLEIVSGRFPADKGEISKEDLAKLEMAICRAIDPEAAYPSNIEFGITTGLAHVYR